MLRSKDLTLLLCLQHAVKQQQPILESGECEEIVARDHGIPMWCVKHVLDSMQGTQTECPGDDGDEHATSVLLSYLSLIPDGAEESSEADSVPFGALEELYCAAAVSVSGLSAFSSFCQSDTIFKGHPLMGGSGRKEQPHPSSEVPAGMLHQDPTANPYLRNSSFGGRYSTHNRQKDQVSCSPWRQAHQQQQQQHQEGEEVPSSPKYTQQADSLNMSELAPLDCLIRQYLIWIRLVKDGLTLEQLSALLDRTYAEWSRVFQSLGAVPADVAEGEPDDAPVRKDARFKEMLHTFELQASESRPNVTATVNKPQNTQKPSMGEIENAIADKDVSTATMLIQAYFDVGNPVLPFGAAGETARHLTAGWTNSGVLANPSHTLAPIAPVSLPEKSVVGGTSTGGRAGSPSVASSGQASIPMATAYSMMCLCELQLETGGLRAAKSCADLAVLVARQVAGSIGTNSSVGNQDSAILVAAHYNRCQWCLRAAKPDAATEDLSIVLQLTQPRRAQSSASKFPASGTDGSLTQRTVSLPQPLVKLRALALIALAEVLAYYPNSIEESLRDLAVRLTQGDLLVGSVGSKQQRKPGNSNKQSTGKGRGVMRQSTMETALSVLALAKECCLFMLNDGASRTETLRTVQALETEFALWGVSSFSLSCVDKSPKSPIPTRQWVADALLLAQRETAFVSLTDLLMKLTASHSVPRDLVEDLRSCSLMKGGLAATLSRVLALVDAQSAPSQVQIPPDVQLVLRYLVAKALYAAGYVTVAQNQVMAHLRKDGSSPAVGQKCGHNLRLMMFGLAFDAMCRLGRFTCALSLLKDAEALASTSHYLPAALVVSSLRSKWHTATGDQPRAQELAEELRNTAVDLGFDHFTTEAELQILSCRVTKFVLTQSVALTTPAQQHGQTTTQKEKEVKDEKTVRTMLATLESSNIVSSAASPRLSLIQEQRFESLVVWLYLTVVTSSGCLMPRGDSGKSLGVHHPCRRSRYLQLGQSLGTEVQMKFVEHLAELTNLTQRLSDGDQAVLESYSLFVSLLHSGLRAFARYATTDAPASNKKVLANGSLFSDLSQVMFLSYERTLQMTRDIVVDHAVVSAASSEEKENWNTPKNDELVKCEVSRRSKLEVLSEATEKC